ncbi:unnamed protein product [Alternaria alternata]|jgi:hypothetical protein|nr:hypothetical protein AALT_g7250 [Alternaria alternata]RYN51621.1 hypothetical protein AA0114_g5221 [Alternaria tenuissima]RYN63674.1 hypothetical protein AA0118_g4578 [Alternaria tenuissima]RYN95115.1 hypothetical protein AA0120_g3802 [Alternaria tenuissima]
MHLERCQGVPPRQRVSSFRFALTTSAVDGAPPSVIIVNRSSAKAPESWKDNADTIEEGLPMLGRRYLNHYAAWSGYTGGSAVLHSCYDVPTRYIPAPALDDSFLASSQSHMIKQHRTFKFTQAIVSDIEAANQAGIEPTVLTIGVDGWFCDTRMILPWLQASTLQFELVIRTSQPAYGMTRRFAEEHGGIYWWTYQTKAILQALEQGAGHDEKTDELIAAWKLLQSSKDVAFGMSCGRNAIDTTLQFSEIE